MKQINQTTYEIEFFGEKTKCSTSIESLASLFEKDKSKKIAAYELIPKGCKIIPRKLVRLCDGLLIGGVLADSIRIVYGIGNGGIDGYYCSIFFLPTEETLKEITNYNSLIGDFPIKD